MVKKSLKHDNAGFLIGNPVTDGSILNLLESIADTSEKTYKAIVAGKKHTIIANSRRSSSRLIATTAKAAMVNAVVSPTVAIGKKQAISKSNKAQELEVMPKTPTLKTATPKAEKPKKLVTESTRALRENQKKSSEVKASNGLAKKIIGLTSSLEAIDLKDNLKQFSSGATDLIEKSDANAEALKEIAVVAKPFGGAVKFIASRGFGKLFKLKKDKEKTPKPLTTNAASMGGMGGMGGMLGSITSFLPMIGTNLLGAGKGLLKNAGSGLLKKIPFISSAMAVFDGVGEYQAAKNNKEKASAIGGAGGAIAGSIAGAAIGTAILPGVGTVIGSVLGEYLGKKLGKAVASSVYKSFDGISSSMSAVWDAAVDKFTSIWDSVKTAALNFFGGKPIEAVKNVWEGIKNTGSGVVDFVKQAANNTINAVSGAWDTAKQTVLSANQSGNINAAAKSRGVPAQLINSIIGIESKFDPNAAPVSKNPQQNKVWNAGAGRMAMSSAYGLGQFIDSTWAEYAKSKFGAKAYEQQSSEERLKNRRDPALQADAVAWYAKQNINKLGKTTTGDATVDAYSVHNLGNKKFVQGLKNNPDALVSSQLTETEIRNNPSLYLDKGRVLSFRESQKKMQAKLHKFGFENSAITASNSTSKPNATTQATPFLAKPIAGIPVATSSFLSNTSLPSVEAPATTSQLQTVSTQKIINTQKNTEKPFWVAQDIGNQRIAHIVSGGVSGKN